MRGPVYWHPLLYEAAMRALYGRAGFEERYKAVAALIPAGTDVVDLCAGDGRLRRFLPSGTPYLAVDINEPFLDMLWKHGVATMHANLKETIPKGDTIVMMAALYHFMPDHVDLVKRAVAAAGSRFILTEPVENVTSSAPGVLSRLSAWASDPGDGSSGKRLGKEDLERILEAVPGGRVVHKAREWVLVWEKNA